MISISNSLSNFECRSSSYKQDTELPLFLFTLWMLKNIPGLDLNWMWQTHELFIFVQNNRTDRKLVLRKFIQDMEQALFLLQIVRSVFILFLLQIVRSNSTTGSLVDHYKWLLKHFNQQKVHFVINIILNRHKQAPENHTSHKRFH